MLAIFQDMKGRMILTANNEIHFGDGEVMQRPKKQDFPDLEAFLASPEQHLESFRVLLQEAYQQFCFCEQIDTFSNHAEI